MSIKPVDLQTLFMQMNHVGKEQSAGKEAIIHGQDHEASKLLKEEDIRDHSVNETSQAGDEAAKVKEHFGQSSQSSKETEAEKKEKEEKGENQEKEVIRESYLGRNIDISG